jgi:aerobic C4-dicarboxylate transport protein
MAAIFIAQATDTPLTVWQQLGILSILLLTSKGAAAVTGGGFITLSATLASTHTVPVSGLSLIIGIDRFMSEGRAVTNFTGNAVATVLIGTWTREFDRSRARSVLAGELPFDEASLTGHDHDGMSAAPDAVGTQGMEEAAVTAEADRRTAAAGTAPRA